VARRPDVALRERHGTPVQPAAPSQVRQCAVLAQRAGPLLQVPRVEQPELALQVARAAARRHQNFL
jgi:hypothetical protein